MKNMSEGSHNQHLKLETPPASHWVASALSFPGYGRESMMWAASLAQLCIACYQDLSQEEGLSWLWISLPWAQLAVKQPTDFERLCVTGQGRGTRWRGWLAPPVWRT
jgi:hypothetical protein